VPAAKAEHGESDAIDAIAQQWARKFLYCITIFRLLAFIIVCVMEIICRYICRITTGHKNAIHSL
jgi:hypothetical protein